MTTTKKKPAARIKKSGRVLWPLALLAFVPFILVFVYLRYMYPASTTAKTGMPPVRFELRGDESSAELAERLTSLGLLDGPSRFRWYAKVVALQPAKGPHLIEQGLAVGDLVARLERHGPKVKLTVPEGFTLFDIAKRLATANICDEKAFTDAAYNPTLLKRLVVEGDSFEGYLFPATYEFPLDADPESIIERLKQEFDKRLATLEAQAPSGRLDLGQSLGWTTREIVTLASMIEKEAVVHEERPVIASVFLNRLRNSDFPRKILQCDPTAAYGCVRARERAEALPAGCQGFTGKITPSVNNDSSNSYSSYTHAGLPPGPIANPGARSLAAVLSPAVTRYLYFVARGEGRHTFSENYEAHQQAIHPTKALP